MRVLSTQHKLWHRLCSKHQSLPHPASVSPHRGVSLSGSFCGALVLSNAEDMTIYLCTCMF